MLLSVTKIEHCDADQLLRVTVRLIKSGEYLVIVKNPKPVPVPMKMVCVQ